MITALIASEVINKPGLNSEYLEVNELLLKHPECETEEEIMVYNSVARGVFTCLDSKSRIRINVNGLHSMFNNTKSLNIINEEDFI